MNSSVGALLRRLEEVSADLVGALELPAEADLTTVAELMETRCCLIDDLKFETANAGPFSYTDFNRMVIIHVQGSRVETRLQAIRQELKAAQGMNAQARAYIHCVHGVLGND
jgi:hypothetical protein